MVQTQSIVTGTASHPMNTSFTDDYRQARERFVYAAHAVGAHVESVIHPTLRAPDGSDLAIDLAWRGPVDAPRVLLVTSGMHGFEGPAGSAVQSAWLENASKSPKPGTAILMVHALNPWGFAWVSRLTENNVDLNRNFVDWNAPPPANPLYAHVRDLIRVPDMSLETLAHLLGAQQRLTAELGPAAMQVAVDFGQCDDAEGISFGGMGPEFGHRVVRDRVVPKLAHAKHIGVVDWHTGVGAFGEIAVLPIDGPGSANAKRLAAWWGEDLVERWKRSPLEEAIAQDPKQSAMPQLKTGQMKQALARWLPHAEMTGAVVEFGTERDGALPDLVYVTLYERWLRFVDRSDRMADAHARFRAMARKCFVPDDGPWRALVLSEGPKLIDLALEGLAR